MELDLKCSNFTFDNLATKEPITSDDMVRCYNLFKSETSNGLTESDFTGLLAALFKSGQRAYHVPQSYAGEIFKKFDYRGDSVIDVDEFLTLWTAWIEVIMRPRACLVVVDVQNDFVTGSMAISKAPSGHRGEDVVPVINRLIDQVKFDLIVYTFDWHPDDHVSFVENASKKRVAGGQPNGQFMIGDVVTFEGPPKVVQKLWPKHCVQNTWGAALHSDIKVAANAVNVYKGTNTLVDSYSAFWDNSKLTQTVLHDRLHSAGITDVFVCGLAYDYCVGLTAFHASEYGYRTALIDDASRGIQLNDIANMKAKLTQSNVVIVDSQDVADMVTGADRRPELGYQLSKNLFQ